MSLSAIALVAVLTAKSLAVQSMTSSVKPVDELYLQAPAAGSKAARKPPAISWSRTPPSGRLAPAPGRRDFFLYPQGENCRPALSKALGTAGEMLPLSKMPTGHLEFAVARLVDGCPVAVPMRADDKIR